MGVFTSLIVDIDDEENDLDDDAPQDEDLEAAKKRLYEQKARMVQFLA